MPTEKISRRDREKLKRRKDILKAAKWVFSRKGFTGASLDEIAARCELAKGTLYYYFGNKEKLFSSVMEETINEITGCLESASSAGDTKTRINRFIEDILSIFQRDYDLILILFRERKRLKLSENCSDDSSIHRGFRELYDKMQQIITDGIKRREIKNLDPLILTSTLMGMIHGIAHAKIFGKISERRPQEEARLLTDIFFQGVKA